ncbi:CBS domain-containing protein [Kribbella deserti]|uniref:CBS domain-containing protein n=1 Tax=Kribbella deserti TaxID=1926257 RepID=A0ABV6QMH0_9ACTN
MDGGAEPGEVPLDGRYRLTRPLGDTAEPRTWQATDEVLNRPVAIHLLPASPAAARQQSEAARSLSQLTDDRLIRVLDLVADPGFIATEWVSGTKLADLELTTDAMVDLIAEAACALATAHAAGLHHGHLNTDSIVWSDAGVVKVLGVGLHASAWRMFDEPRRDTDALRRMLTSNAHSLRLSRSLRRVVRRPYKTAAELAEALAPFRPAQSELRQRLVSAEPAEPANRPAARRTREVMDTNIITVSEDTPVNELAALLARSHCPAIPVVDAAGHVTGLVSAADLP